MYDNVGVCGHDLLFGGQVCALLEFKVANGSGQGEVSIDTSEVDKAASGGDPCLFACERKKVSRLPIAILVIATMT